MTESNFQMYEEILHKIIKNTYDKYRYAHEEEVRQQLFVTGSAYLGKKQLTEVKDDDSSLKEDGITTKRILQYLRIENLDIYKQNELASENICCDSEKCNILKQEVKKEEDEEDE